MFFAKDKLPGLSELTDRISQIKKNLSEAWELVHEAENVTREVQIEVNETSELQKAEVKEIEDEIFQRLQNIRTMLTQAQRVFSTLELTMELKPKTAVSLLPPPVTRQTPTYKDFSFLMKTLSHDGVLLYYGDKPSQRFRRADPTGCQSDSYALMVVDSYVTFVVCQNNEFHYVNYDRNVSDGNWYDVHASQ